MTDSKIQKILGIWDLESGHSAECFFDKRPSPSLGSDLVPANYVIASCYCREPGEGKNN